MNDPQNVFWDSCVFIRYLTNSPADHVDDIEQLIQDAKKGTRRIYCSSICFTEVRPRYFRQRGFGTIHEFFAAIGPGCEPVDPNPNILALAGELKDADPVNPSDPKVDEANKRVVGTADAIHLATCLFLRDVMGVSDVVFHTFDEGKGTTWEGKCVPLIGFDRWFPAKDRIPVVADVCSLNRCKPVHPQPNLPLGGKPDGPSAAVPGSVH